jgi:hypothetical protein
MVRNPVYVIDAQKGEKLGTQEYYYGVLLTVLGIIASGE